MFPVVFSDVFACCLRASHMASHQRGSCLGEDVQFAFLGNCAKLEDAACYKPLGRPGKATQTFGSSISDKKLFQHRRSAAASTYVKSKKNEKQISGVQTKLGLSRGLQFCLVPVHTHVTAQPAFSA